MTLWKEAQSPALKTEEAALLTALPRTMVRGAALKTALRTAGRAKDAQVREIHWEGGADPSRAQQVHAAPPASRGRNCASLHQVWNRP